MSQKITSKNLSYSSSLPPFLAALHAQAGNSTGPDPLLARQRRAVKKRSASEEAEDVPLVLDEDGNAVDVEVGKDGTVKEKEKESSVKRGEEGETETDIPNSKKEEAKLGFGARKRKTGKIVGDDAGEDEVKAESSKQGTRSAPSQSDQASTQSKEKRPKKKAKKIKLSFDEED
ncbi:hypothetical protein NLU13_7124 [Sarocladium strictum]|uniref:DUF4604 domain-containing protein n=1 Tax=Sarocladium strictum TaxID=5046 RepID=A0AA39GFF0_SARSR|nr:hypothetical protein NLU13_7124 [Sarocladium strictum]